MGKNHSVIAKHLAPEQLEQLARETNFPRETIHDLRDRFLRAAKERQRTSQTDLARGSFAPAVGSPSSLPPETTTAAPSRSPGVAQRTPRKGKVGDVHLDRAAFAGVLRDAGIHAEESVIASLFDIFDHNNNGQVSFLELLTSLAVFLHGDPDQAIRATFSFFDLAGNGSITKDEFRTACRCLNRSLEVVEFAPPATSADGSFQIGRLGDFERQIDTFVDAVFEEFDRAGDGVLSAEEFHAVLTRHPWLRAYTTDLVRAMAISATS
eukprot:TRINITY_DN45002_c0_g1_i1.p1 TRINITY_DN45002_c0_g1~~TRINITY_DN45002_c0_g1_i1.p1  ORF type:complete len:266 (+),score=36.05 TRINITY_DN45002_c0_g1_i1:103-900(+)